MGKVGLGEKDEWKAKMRAAERIERRRLEEKRARNGRYTWSLTGLHPKGYLRTVVPIKEGMSESKAKWISGSVLLKLAYELRERDFLSVGPQDSDCTTADWRRELGHVWTVTMPSIAGIAGINPLTVHYCFRPHKEGKDKRGRFWLAVLEVHNTFSERHIYVLEAGKNEDSPTEGEGKRGGYDHQWTFARSFHVSPFNDRGGFYRLFLKEPFTQESNTFNLGIRLLLLVEDPSSPPDQPGVKLVKKLMATLDSIPPPSSKTRQVGRMVRPLSSATLYVALMRQPIDLFMTFVRILWEAGKLHFVKKLDAFGRPDMVQLSEPASDTSYDGIGLPPPTNRIQPHRQKGSNAEDASVGLVYPEAGWAENVAKEYVKGLIERRVKELEDGKGEKWEVWVESTDPADLGIHVQGQGEGGGKERKLTLYTRSHGVYVDLMTYTPPRLALLLGSIVGRRWGVSSIADFDAFFPPTRALARSRQVEFLLSSSTYDRTQGLALLEAFGIPTSSPTEAQAGEKKKTWRVKTALGMGYAAAVAEKKVFGWLGARYVKGTEPWLELDRGLRYLERRNEEEGSSGEGVGEAGWDTRLGSVYNP